MKILQKTVIGDLAASNEQRTIISAFGINILERRRVLLGTANISGGGGGYRRVAKHKELFLSF